MEFKFNIIKGLKEFYSNSKHVLAVSYKPNVSTFERTVKVVLIGTLVLGIMGFIIAFVLQVITGG